MKNIPIIFFFILVSCKKDIAINKENTTIKKNELVILTESDNINNPFYIGQLNSFKNYTKLEHLTNQSYDTLKIEVDSWEMITIGAKDSFLDTLMISKNDTLHLKLKNGVIIKNIINRDIETWSYKSILKENQIKKTADSIYNLFFKRIIVSKKIKPLIVKSENFKLKLSSNRIKPNKINSKIKSKLFHEIIDKYKKLLIIYNNSNLSKGLDSDKVIFLNRLLEKEIFTKIKYLYYSFKDPKLINFLGSNTFLNEKNINTHNEFIYIHNLLNIYFTKTKKRSYLRPIDLYEAYDSIPYYFGKKYSEKARMISLINIANKKFNIDSLSKYVNKFNSFYKNKFFEKHFEDKYLINLKNFYNVSDEVNFVNIKEETGNLQALINSLKGNIIYIDYWASWCGPCRKVMPDSKKLQELYKNKNVKFVYLSIDKNKDQWISASKAVKIHLNKHNYLVLNHEASNFKNTLKITKIPRYLLYNKKGKLINHNAPGPETNEIRKLFNQYLKE